MKKIKKLLIIMLLLIPCFVKADMSAPTLREFEIVVVNENGVDYEKNQYNDEATGHLNKGDKVLVLYDYDGVYTIGYKVEKDGYTHNETLGTVKSMDGFMIVEETVDPTKLSEDFSIIKYDTKMNAIIIDKDGVYMYQGPSDLYKKITKIKYNTQVTYNYAIRSESGITHIYVTYNGKKGWVDILDKKVLIKNDNQYIFREDYETECGTIPKNTITTPNYKTDAWSKLTQFEYKGCKTFINAFRSDQILVINSGSQENPRNYKTKTDMTIYEYADVNSKPLKTIPAGSEIVLLAGGDFMAGTDKYNYISSDGTQGWSLNSIEDFEYIELPYKKITIKDNIKISKIDEIMDKNDKKVSKKEETKKNEQKKLITGKELIILCAGGAVVLSLTTLVIIVLVNKKKKSKNEVNNTQKEE